MLFKSCSLNHIILITAVFFFLFYNLYLLITLKRQKFLLTIWLLAAKKITRPLSPIPLVCFSTPLPRFLCHTIISMARIWQSYWPCFVPGWFKSGRHDPSNQHRDFHRHLIRHGNNLFRITSELKHKWASTTTFHDEA